MVDALIRLFLTEEAFSTVQDEVERAMQEPEEEGGNYVYILSKAACLRLGIFTKYNLVKYYVLGLKPVLRDDMIHNG